MSGTGFDPRILPVGTPGCIVGKGSPAFKVHANCEQPLANHAKLASFCCLVHFLSHALHDGMQASSPNSSSFVLALFWSVSFCNRAVTVAD